MAATHPLIQNVSRETRQRLEAYTELLIRWNRKINLIAKTDLDGIWSRHIADSLQMADHIPAQAQSWIDLGSGAGFPALIVAIGLEDRKVPLTLVESDQRKAAFLREAIRVTETPATVENTRIEHLTPRPFDVISARALAPLSKLLEYAEPLAHEDTILLFLKGQQLESELTEAKADWHIDHDRVPSRTDSHGAILKIVRFARRS